MSMIRRIFLKICSFVSNTAGSTSTTAPCRLKKQLPTISETVGPISNPGLLVFLSQTRNYKPGSKPKHNPYGEEASANFARNKNYGEDGCIHCRQGTCTLKAGDLSQQPIYRTSPRGDFPCLYCDANFETMEDLRVHQVHDHPFLFCPRSPSQICETCSNAYRGKKDDHECPSPANK